MSKIVGLKRLRARVLSALGLALAGPAMAYDNPAWTQPQAPFHIVDNVYYVGSKALAAYLIVSPAGDVLLDATLPENAPMIERNIEALGFKLHDVRILLNSHAHFDHAGALARLKRDTGATFMASPADRWALEHGISRGDNTAGIPGFPKVKVDKVLADGQAVTLGPIAMTVVLTPGHTPGCTSWTLPVHDHGVARTVAFPCSLSVAGNVLVGNRAYPEIVADYRKSFARLSNLKPDIVLTAHPEFADVLGREQRQMAGAKDAFVDPGQMAAILKTSQADFDKELARQEAARRMKP
jgi:metallo-beta-lactamase class B